MQARQWRDLNKKFIRILYVTSIDYTKLRKKQTFLYACNYVHQRTQDLCGRYYSDSTTYSCTLIHGRGVGLEGGEAFWQHKLTFAISIIDFT